MKRRLVLVIHNVRSVHNVGSMFRTADAFGVEKLYLTGYTPYPPAPGDDRLPHEIKKVANRLNKTALGAENVVAWEHQKSVFELLKKLSQSGFEIAALEQTETASNLDHYAPAPKLAVIVGSEIGGLDRKVIDAADYHLQIPMMGQKESLNVAVAAGIALYHLRYGLSKE